MRVEDINVDADLSSIFAIKADKAAEIAADMRLNGYDKSQPVVIDGELKFVVDGHTRLAAAKMAGLAEIPVVEKSFETKEDAVLYCYRRQLARRNLTPSEILMAVQRLEGRRAKYGTGRAGASLAKELGVSPATVNRAKKVLAEAPKEKIEAIKNGNKTITGVFNEIKKPEAKIKTDVRDEIKKPEPETEIKPEIKDDANEIELTGPEEIKRETENKTSSDTMRLAKLGKERKLKARTDLRDAVRVVKNNAKSFKDDEILLELLERVSAAFDDTIWILKNI
jgi:ParB family chromosome partitioning protein